MKSGALGLSPKWKLSMSTVADPQVLGDAYRVAGSAQVFFQKVQTTSPWRERVYSSFLCLWLAFDETGRGFPFSVSF